MRELVDDIRNDRLQVPEGTATHVIAWHRTGEGELLETEVAAVELINVLRPTVAIAHYVTFAALALDEHPEAAQRVRDGSDPELEQFVQEVRRLAPFFPLVAGRVVEPFEWRESAFPHGRWVLLDLYGTNRDPRSWEEPDEFRPERFDRWEGDLFSLIPQGGGDHHRGHRCPGGDDRAHQGRGRLPRLRDHLHRPGAGLERPPLAHACHPAEPLCHPRRACRRVSIRTGRGRRSARTPVARPPREWARRPAVRGA